MRKGKPFSKTGTVTLTTAAGGKFTQMETDIIQLRATLRAMVCLADEWMGILAKFGLHFPTYRHYPACLRKARKLLGMEWK